MAYTPTNWVDNVTPVDAARMNNIEAGISALGEGIQYENVYSPATPYQPGDVVSYGGIQFLAVNPSTGVTPPTPSGATVGYVPQDAVTVAGVRLVATKLVGSDAQPAFQILGDGRMEWGAGGASATDASLRRYAAGILSMDALLRLTRPTSTDGLLWSRVGAEATERFRARSDGYLQWGDGTAAQDVTLYRSAIDTLKTDDDFHANTVRAVGATHAFYARNLPTTAWAALMTRVLSPADTADRFVIRGDGKMEWGTGSAAADTTLYRGGVNVLSTGGTVSAAAGFYSGPFSTPTSLAYYSNVTSDTQIRFQIAANGAMTWGDGVAPLDTNLYRGAANKLQTDDDLQVGGVLTLAAGVWHPTSDTKPRFLHLANGASYYKGGDPVPANNQIVFRAASDADMSAFDLPTTDTWTALTLYCRATGGAGAAMRRVVVGAADSGGSGFRSLRVVN